MGRHFGDDSPHIQNESHIKHPIRFVKDEDFDVRQVDTLSFKMVEQSPGSCDDDVDAAA